MINVMSWFFWLKNDYFLYKSDFQIHAAATIMEIYRIRHIVDGKQLGLDGTSVNPLKWRVVDNPSKWAC